MNVYACYYPPMDQVAVGKILEAEGCYINLCPWGCKGQLNGAPLFVEDVTPEVMRFGFFCWGCRRRWTVSELVRGCRGKCCPHNTQFLPGWPLDAHINYDALDYVGEVWRK